MDDLIIETEHIKVRRIKQIVIVYPFVISVGKFCFMLDSTEGFLVRPDASINYVLVVNSEDDIMKNEHFILPLIRDSFPENGVPGRSARLVIVEQQHMDEIPDAHKILKTEEATCHRSQLTKTLGS